MLYSYGSAHVNQVRASPSERNSVRDAVYRLERKVSLLAPQGRDSHWTSREAIWFFCYMESSYRLRHANRLLTACQLQALPDGTVVGRSLHRGEFACQFVVEYYILYTRAIEQSL